MIRFFGSNVFFFVMVYNLITGGGEMNLAKPQHVFKMISWAVAIGDEQIWVMDDHFPEPKWSKQMIATRWGLSTNQFL